MLTSPDFKELLQLFEKHNVRYLVVGGYAVMQYSEPRFTKDLDLFIAMDQKNCNGSVCRTERIRDAVEKSDAGRFGPKRLFLSNGKAAVAD